MKLSKWAKQQGIHYNTAYRWFKENKLPVAAYQSETGTILVQETKPKLRDNKVWIYCRVSSYEKKDDLQRQAERCIQFCNANGYEIQKVVKEVASGMNDARPKLTHLLDSQPTRIVVEHKDRLTRFGLNYFNQLLPKLNCELIVINMDQDTQEDLIKDLIAIITSFCC